MAKVIRSLTSRASHTTRSEKSPNTASRTAKETKRREERDLALAAQKRPALRAAKVQAETWKAPATSRRERPLPATLFALLTPRQVKHIKSRPDALNAKLEEYTKRNETN